MRRRREERTERNPVRSGFFFSLSLLLLSLSLSLSRNPNQNQNSRDLLPAKGVGELVAVLRVLDGGELACLFFGGGGGERERERKKERFEQEEVFFLVQAATEEELPPFFWPSPLLLFQFRYPRVLSLSLHIKTHLSRPRARQAA